MANKKTVRRLKRRPCWFFHHVQRYSISFDCFKEGEQGYLIVFFTEVNQVTENGMFLNVCPIRLGDRECQIEWRAFFFFFQAGDAAVLSLVYRSESDLSLSCSPTLLPCPLPIVKKEKLREWTHCCFHWPAHKAKTMCIIFSSSAFLL